MNALILAAGLGTRLKGIADDTPKPMLPIGQFPLLDLLIKKLLKLNVNKIIINTHHKAEVIEKFISEQPYHEKISLTHEEKLLGTAGTLRRHINFLALSSFIVMHGDNYFDDDLTTMIAAHKKQLNDSLITMGTFVTREPEKCGTVICDKNGRVLQFFEKTANSLSNQANSAIYIMNPEVKNIINSLSAFETDISKNLIPKFLGQIHTHPLKGDFIDIGTPESLALARKLALAKS